MKLSTHQVFNDEILWKAKKLWLFRGVVYWEDKILCVCEVADVFQAHHAEVGVFPACKLH